MTKTRSRALPPLVPPPQPFPSSLKKPPDPASLSSSRLPASVPASRLDKTKGKVEAFETSRPAQPKPWNALFKTTLGEPSRSSEQSARIFQAVAGKYSNSIVFSEEKLAEWRDEWKNSLIGKFLTKSPPLHILKAVVKKIWFSTLPEIIDLANGYFIFKFRSNEDSLNILTGGPWTILGEVLNLIPWFPDFQPLLHKIKSAPIWVRILGLPMEYWSTESLWAIAGDIGKPLKIDERATIFNRGKFVRICVEVNLDKPLPEGVWIGTEKKRFFQVFSYENLPAFCTDCGRLGHKLQDCLRTPAEMVKKLEATHVWEDASSKTSETASTVLVGNEQEKNVPIPSPWIRVQPRRQSRRNRRPPDSKHNNDSAGEGNVKELPESLLSLPTPSRDNLNVAQDNMSVSRQMQEINHQFPDSEKTTANPLLNVMETTERSKDKMLLQPSSIIKDAEHNGLGGSHLTTNLVQSKEPTLSVWRLQLQGNPSQAAPLLEGDSRDTRSEMKIIEDTSNQLALIPFEDRNLVVKENCRMEAEEPTQFHKHQLMAETALNFCNIFGGMKEDLQAISNPRLSGGFLGIKPLKNKRAKPNIH